MVLLVQRKRSSLDHAGPSLIRNAINGESADGRKTVRVATFARSQVRPARAPSRAARPREQPTPAAFAGDHTALRPGRSRRAPRRAVAVPHLPADDDRPSGPSRKAIGITV